MPTSVLELFDSVELLPEGPIEWGHSLPSRTGSGSGVYVVALSSTPEDKSSCLIRVPPLNRTEIMHWIDAVPKLKVDGVRPPKEALVGLVSDRLARYWLPDEPILYIGTTSRTIKQRVCEYYSTELGERQPHRGGHWLKTLSILNSLYIYWALTPNAEDVEKQLLRTFAGGTLASRDIAHDTQNGTLPFANLKPVTWKKHNIRPQARD